MANEFDSAIDDYRRRLAEHSVSPRGNLYRFFADRSREFSPESQAYLEKRFLDEPDQSNEDRPSMRRRLLLLRSYPAVSQNDPRPARELVTEMVNLQDQLHRLMIGSSGEPVGSSSAPVGVPADTS
ncbi:MAG: hypothetical protein JJ992_02945 [Planctomycetes bacterium]|nr:hypothetical protein [Planctomycetota bacterium]